MDPRQRVTLITLGVADLSRATAFYRAWGSTPRPAPEDQGIGFFQMLGSALTQP